MGFCKCFLLKTSRNSPEHTPKKNPKPPKHLPKTSPKPPEHVPQITETLPKNQFFWGGSCSS